MPLGSNNRSHARIIDGPPNAAEVTQKTVSAINAVRNARNLYAIAKACELINDPVVMAELGKPEYRENAQALYADLSAIQRGTGRIQGIFRNPTYDGTKSVALVIATAVADLGRIANAR